ncbi:MAG: (d)CMP kinase [Verrucomicrobiaceae bacterium]|nr:(d)CMP kinase [Verrucomicrobiaceae bacterium]
MSETHPVIAIDGPAASGKSSVARKIAARLGWTYVNTGNMYRAMTHCVLSRGLSLSDSPAIGILAAEVPLSLEVQDGNKVVTVIDHDCPSDEVLNSEEVNRSVSYVAQVPEVRERLVAEQRALAKRGPVVMEGRDIGSVVFPATPLKLYIDASEEVRARRRAVQGHADSVGLRDKIDSTRKTAPLVIPDGAVVIDSSEIGLNEVVDAACEALTQRGVSFT